ncbi:CotH kinase family protein [Saccharopolyspora sp. 6T]|uniref:CotH kinase family protein n=1 Tax=Saccharopolyspora sp. 6T TaxID=2877238 RepID=UPI001CD6536B|nr:CotH kinase family protein [Saccharopolyspora sp. 6T]MCA1184983.1 CotH kinase family protein [Saccharopolyspora sp. 6T]
MTSPQDPEAPKRRWRHRVPVRLRHHWKVPAGLLAVVAVLLLVFGDARVRPLFVAEPVVQESITQDIAGTGDLFDGGDHRIEVRFDQAEYADMMRTFREEGEKQFIRADITIDGTAVEDVGLRLKGNSTLMSLRGQDGRGPGGMPGGGPDAEVPRGGGQDPAADAPADDTGTAVDGAEPPADGAETPADEADAPADGAEPPADDAGDRQQNRRGGPSMASLSEDEPEKLPWLISFEEFAEGRAYQGHSEITLRPEAGGTATALNEALALELTAAAGETTQPYTLTTVSVNGGAAVPRLLLDPPDAAWAEQHGDGVLYKARAGGSFEYLGDDPTDYEEAFKQINSEGDYDLQPVLDLLSFVDEADDEEFAAELDEHVDTASFARYLALQNLMSNGDAMDGPGNNYYLWYDTGQDRFTVLSWDLNLSFSGMGMGPGGGGPGEEPGGGAGDQGGVPGQPGGGMPGGGMPGGGMPGGPDGEQPGGRPGGSGGGPRGSGALKERFLADEHFRAAYEQAYADLHRDLIADGTAIALLDRVTTRAEGAGDEAARTARDTLAQQITTTSPTPREDVGIGPPGR